MASEYDGTYEVGRGKPPRHTRFKRGQSGNPNGRPRGSRNAYNVLSRQLAKKVVIVADGKRTKVTLLEAAMRQLANGAATGKLRHIQLLLQLFPFMERAQKMVSRKPPKLTTMTEEEWTREVVAILQKAGALDLGSNVGDPALVEKAPSEE